MSLMYRRRPSDAPIDQGDVLLGVPRLSGSLNEAILVLHGEDLRVKDAATPLAGGQAVAMVVDLVDALVLSQGCDVLRRGFVHLAPIDELRNLSDKAAKRASSVRKAATGLDAVGAFYLPNLPRLGWPRRIAALDDAFALPGDELREYVRRHRSIACGLTPAAIEYLQYRIGLVFGRKAREDEDWPSVEDLRDQRVEKDLEIQKRTQERARAADPGEQDEIESELTQLRRELASIDALERRIAEHLAAEFP